MGLDGNVWRKLPIVWGYSDVYQEFITDTNLGGGNEYVNGAVVLPGFVHVVTGILYRYDGTVPDRIEFAPYVDGNATTIGVLYTIVSGVYYPWDGTLFLKEGDKLAWYLVGSTALDDFYGRAVGYKMKIAE